jgi:hypothetical protein
MQGGGQAEFGFSHFAAGTSLPAVSAARRVLPRPRARPEVPLSLQVRVRGADLDERISGRLHGGALLLSLSEFAKILDFSISVDLPNGRASGTYSEGKRPFSFDYRARTVSTDGTKRKFDGQSVELDEDGIFVDSRLLAGWFPVDIRFDRGNAVVELRDREEYPSDQRIAAVDPNAVDSGPVEIVTPSVDLVAASDFGQMAGSSPPPVRSDSLRTTRIAGELPPGWQVELYRNGVLINFQESRSDERYEFAAVPLLSGANVLQLQFFGPEGQYREQTRRILAGSAQFRPGNLNYRVSVSREASAGRTVGSGDSLGYSNQNSGNEARASAELEYAATDNLSLTGSTRTVSFPEGRNSYFGLGARYRAGPMQSHLDLLKDLDGGMAGTLGTRLRLPFNLSLSGEQELDDNFTSEEIPDDGDLPVNRTEAQLAGALPLWAGRQLPFKFMGNYENSQSGASVLELGNQLSLAADGLSVTNDVWWRQSWPEAGATNSADGTFSLGTAGPGGRITGNLGYAIKPEMGLTSALLRGEWLLGYGLKARAGLTRSFASSANSLSASLTRQFEALSLCVTGNYSEDDAAAILFTLGISAFP